MHIHNASLTTLGLGRIRGRSVIWRTHPIKYLTQLLLLILPIIIGLCRRDQWVTMILMHRISLSNYMHLLIDIMQLNTLLVHRRGYIMHRVSHVSNTCLPLLICSVSCCCTTVLQRQHTIHIIVWQQTPTHFLSLYNCRIQTAHSYLVTVWRHFSILPYQISFSAWYLRYICTLLLHILHPGYNPISCQ